MPDDDCKWGVPFTDRQQKTRYALGLFLHPFGVEKPLLIGQLSSDVAEVFVPFLRSRAATIGASFLDFNSFNPYASMHVVFHIYGSLEVKAALNNSAPYDSIFIFGFACKCFCKFNSCPHHVYNIEGCGKRLARSCAKANGVLLWLRKSRRPML